MKKYIRTKDGICEKDKLIYAFNDNEEYLIKDIVKEADTIEELCDEFVVLEKGKTKPFVHDIYCRDLDRYIKENATIYGAIWTDKGLIYVAKMNDKGEFELLWNKKD